MRDVYEKMTVLDLRRVAKEKGVKLGAGISKQGIIDKLLADEDSTSAQETPVQEAPAVPAVRRTASIITDDENEDSDDVPVLTANVPSTYAARKAAPRTPAPAPAQPSSLSSISSKAPAFTMEGSRAWHNPLAYQTQPGYQNRTQSRPLYGADRYNADKGLQDSRYAAQRPQSPRPPRPQVPYQTQYQAPSRFGPEQPQQETPYPQEAPAQEAPVPYRNEYAPRPQQDFIPPTAPEYSRREADAAPMRDLPVSNAQAAEMLMTGECGEGEGVLDIHPDGYGFLRTDNFLPGKNDVYVANAQIRRFSLRPGDYVEGKTRPQQAGSRYSALLYITKINGRAAEEMPQRVSFEQFTAIYPKKRITLGEEGDLFFRAVDLLCPIGFGQRALIHVPPRGGRTTLIKKMANRIHALHPDVQLMTLLIDERPEDVADMRECIPGDVIHSTFDAPQDNHVRVSELALERAQRLVEQKKHVVLFVDSLTRLARACNNLAPQSARALPNGLVPSALAKAKRLLGAARNTREGGSLTVIAMLQRDTLNPLDEALNQEFANTANMELFLERIPGEKRMLPCVNAHKGGTRHDELMLTQEEAQKAADIRAALGESAPRSALKLIAMLEE